MRESDFIHNMRWIVNHARAYEGKWVALLGGGLIDSDVNRAVLRERIKDHKEARYIILMPIEKL